MASTAVIHLFVSATAKPDCECVSVCVLSEYEILNLYPGASMKSIRTAYHARMSFWNTDKHHNHKQAEEHIRRIRDAYNTLVGMNEAISA